jgi:hypothetical protein
MGRANSYLAVPWLVTACALLTGAAGYFFLDGRRGVAYSFLGAAIVVVEWFRNRQSVSAWALFPAAFLVAFYFVRVRLLAGTAGIQQSRTWDIYALYVDGSFGFQPSVWVHSLVAKSSVTELLFQAVYEALPVAIAAAYAFNLVDRRRWKLFAMMVLVAVIGVQCYKLFPVCGPAYLPFGNECFYYHGSCSISQFFNGVPYMISINDQWPRNGMPSLHMSWALLSWWACRERPTLRWVMLTFALLTAIATLAYGEHYLIDLAAAFPFSLAIWFLCMEETPFSNPARIFPLIGGSLGFVGWIWVLRFAPQFFLISVLIPWTALILSVSCVLIVIWTRPQTA